MKARLHAQRGASMVEFALLSGLLLLLVFGLVEFSRAMYTYHAVANAARIGSRWAMVRGTQSCTDQTGQALKAQTGHCPAQSADVQSYVQSAVGMIDPKPLAVTAAWPGNSGCPATDPSHQSAGCIVQVTASNQFDFSVPFVSTLPITISSTSQMVISQ